MPLIIDASASALLRKIIISFQEMLIAVSEPHLQECFQWKRQFLALCADLHYRILEGEDPSLLARVSPGKKGEGCVAYCSRNKDYNISLVTQVTMEGTKTFSTLKGLPGESCTCWAEGIIVILIALGLSIQHHAILHHKTDSPRIAVCLDAIPLLYSACCQGISQALQAAPSLQDTTVFAIILLLPDPVVLKVSS